MYILSFYKNLFLYKIQCTTDSCRTFIKDILTSSLTMEQKNIWESEQTEKEIYEALASIANNKSPGNDGLTKEFYYTYWSKVKDIFMDSLSESK